ncbi:hypothetical protein GW7_07384 [Heterocephalus glaber]|uniref:Uncharacterized protein n=1 Tax=Heterocephalus glaber TaxID=10181 RepID=G5BF19_HETGA|nr:hypothetical protein GW7_07384 [Heterocephalus glaber]
MLAVLCLEDVPGSPGRKDPGEDSEAAEWTAQSKGLRTMSTVTHSQHCVGRADARGSQRKARKGPVGSKEGGAERYHKATKATHPRVLNTS